MLAKALAGESGVNFLQATAAGFQNKYVGESEENIRRLFQRAKSFVLSWLRQITTQGLSEAGSRL
ncbi:MAG: AAA family ATPase [Lachnospiraceae bacterium]|nr:AAA family ATPase [Lachnospiraceae bacterium]